MNQIFYFLFFFINIVVLLCASEVAADDEKDYEHGLRTIEAEFSRYINKKKHRPIPMLALKVILEPLQLRRDHMKNELFGETSCGICKHLIKKIQTRTITMEIVIRTICNLYISFSTFTLMSSFCDNVAALNLPTLRYILKNSEILDPEHACSILMQSDLCYYEKPPLTWKIQVKDKPQNLQISTKPSQSDSLTIVHLSDFHITPDYDIGGIADCGYPVCCKKGLGNPFLLLKGRAGKWGEYTNCDTPVHTFLNVLHHIRATHKKIDAIYFTGDVIDHAIWDTSVPSNSKLIRFTFEKLLEIFPGVAVFPVIGNHEATPLNVYPPPEINAENFSQQWIYDLLTDLWKPWLPEDALRTVKRQGYYSVSLKNKLRVIGLNNNICYVYNWWLLYNTSYLHEQLNFLKDNLEQAEANGEFVHIIAHIPPGNKECIQPWESNYLKLISRYSHIIKGQFFGHTHTDELKVFYDVDQKDKAINVGYNGASVTPYQNYNPNYRIYHVDADNFSILDADTYTFNLTEANLNPNRSPAWYKLYSMRKDYNLPNLEPETVGQLATQFLTNQSLTYQYFRYYARDGDASLQEGCDRRCLKKLACTVLTTNSIEPIDECREY